MFLLEFEEWTMLVTMCHGRQLQRPVH
jgi:hypothetical protein